MSEGGLRTTHLLPPEVGVCLPSLLHLVCKTQLGRQITPIVFLAPPYLLAPVHHLPWPSGNPKQQLGTPSV